MKKFGEIYKEKVNEAETRQESKVLGEFRVIYNALLEHYTLKTIHELDDNSQISFLTELNQYWSEDSGLSEKGQKFLDKRSMYLNENSTTAQKKNYLKEKAAIVINETMRQTNLKFKIYDIIDEMYKQINGDDVSDILNPDTITNILGECFLNSIKDLTGTINIELKESVKPKRRYNARKVND